MILERELPLVALYGLTVSQSVRLVERTQEEMTSARVRDAVTKFNSSLGKG